MRSCSSGFSRANSPSVPKPALLTSMSMVIRRSASVRATSSAAPGSDRSIGSTVAVMLCARDSSSASACSFGGAAREQNEIPPPGGDQPRQVLADSPRRTRDERDFRHESDCTEFGGGMGGATETLDGGPELTGSTRRHEDERRRTKAVERSRPVSPDATPVLGRRRESLRDLFVRPSSLRSGLRVEPVLRPLRQPITSPHCHRVDLHAQAGARQARDLDGRARGTVVAEHPGVDAVHLLELGHVDEEDAAAHDVAEARARGLEDGRDVAQRLLGLRLHVVGQVAGAGIAAGLAGDEDEVADDDAGRVGADRRGELEPWSRVSGWRCRHAGDATAARARRAKSQFRSLTF